MTPICLLIVLLLVSTVQVISLSNVASNLKLIPSNANKRIKTSIFSHSNNNNNNNIENVDSKQKFFLGKLIPSSKFLVAVAISTSLSLQDIMPSLAAAPGTVANPVQLVSMEKAIVGLEQAESRGETVQALADLYEVVNSKTLLARSKYKYVRLIRIKSRFYYYYYYYYYYFQ